MYAAVLTILGWIYLIFSRNKYHWYAVLLFGIVVLKTLPYLLLSSAFRFRAAIDPFLIIIFSFTLIWIFSNGNGIKRAENGV
jgi:hypothetical protein